MKCQEGSPVPELVVQPLEEKGETEFRIRNQHRCRQKKWFTSGVKSAETKQILYMDNQYEAKTRNYHLETPCDLEGANYGHSQAVVKDFNIF
jgi:hypothetical protein